MKQYITMNNDLKYLIMNVTVAIILMSLVIWNVLGLLSPNLVNKELLLFVDCLFNTLNAYHIINKKFFKDIDNEI